MAAGGGGEERRGEQEPDQAAAGGDQAGWQLSRQELDLQAHQAAHEGGGAQNSVAIGPQAAVPAGSVVVVGVVVGVVVVGVVGVVVGFAWGAIRQFAISRPDFAPTRPGRPRGRHTQTPQPAARCGHPPAHAHAALRLGPSSVRPIRSGFTT